MPMTPSFPSASIPLVRAGEPISAAWGNQVGRLITQLLHTVDMLSTEVTAIRTEKTLNVVDLDEDVTATDTEKEGGMLGYDTAWYDNAQTVGRIADADGGLHLQHERVLTYYVSNAGRRVMVPLSLEIHLARLDAELTFESSATASIYEGNPASSGTYTDSGENVTVYDWLLSSGESIASGTNIIIFRHPSSRDYIVLGAQCP